MNHLSHRRHAFRAAWATLAAILLLGSLAVTAQADEDEFDFNEPLERPASGR